jgi:hypothetical protein
LNHSGAPAELPVVRHLIRARRAGVLVTAAAGGVLLIAGPALADATVNPPSAPQGDGADLAFHITNTASQPISRLQLQLPRDTPVAEVYPLSVPDWAPQITQRKLSTPLDTIHGGTPVTETAQDITWIAMSGRSLAPGASTDLSVSLGPLPTVGQMQFTIVPTYADGRTGAPMPPVVLTLTPAAPGQAPAGHAGHSGTTGTGGTATTDPDAGLFAQTVAQAEQGPSLWSIGGWVVAALAALGGLGAVLRSRRTVAADRQDTDGDEPDQDGTKEPVTAGAPRITTWSYRDGPAG